MKKWTLSISCWVIFLTAGTLGLSTVQTEGNTQHSKTGPTIPVTSTIEDNDISNPGACLLPGQVGTTPNLCLFHSDGSGAYTEPDVVSEIFQDTYWLLDLSGQTLRTVDITFSNNWKAAAGGPTNPPLRDGLYPTSTSDALRLISRCYASSAGSTIVNFVSVTTSDPYCSLRVEISQNGAQYLFVMAPIFQGTGFATVVCNKAASGACVDSTIAPTPSSLGGPNPNVANLYSVNPKNGRLTLLGSANNSFVVHVTNP